jgi:hypothetical protein
LKQENEVTTATTQLHGQKEELGAHAKHYAYLLYLNLDSVLEGDKYYEN